MTERNQCDGCAVGAPLNIWDNHQMPDGGRMACTAHLYATPAPAQPDPLHVANERGEGEANIERLAETARNTYFGVSRRGPVQFGSIHPQSQQIWRNVVKAVLGAAPKEKP